MDGTKSTASLAEWLMLLIALVYSASISSSSAQTLPCLPWPPGLVSWWKGESNALDSVGTNHGALQNELGFAPGEVSTAFNFDGIDDYFFVNPSTSLDVGLGSGFTFEGWINPSNVDIQMPIAEYERALGTFDGNDVGVHFDISVPPGSGTGPASFYANVKDTNGVDHIVTSLPNLVTNGGWQHVALTYD